MKSPFHSNVVAVPVDDSNLYQGSTYPYKKIAVSVSKVMWGALQKHHPLVDVETLIPGIPGISARSPWALQGFGWWVGS